METKMIDNILVLIADDGKVMQNKGDLYIYGKQIHLGLNDGKNNWQEIDELDIPLPIMPIEEII